MRKWLKFEDGHIVELSPLTYEEFMCLDHWVGASDMAFDNWLRKNELHEASSFNEESLKTAQFYITEDTKNLVFQRNLDSNGDLEEWLPYSRSYAKSCPVWTKTPATTLKKND